MPNQAPAHWSKDFVEHLRTVHFTLIGICVGLIVLASFPSKTEIQIAHEQVSQILELTKVWTVTALHTEAANTLKTEAKTTRGYALNNKLPMTLDFAIQLTTADKKVIWLKPILVTEGWFEGASTFPPSGMDFSEGNVEAFIRPGRPTSIKSFRELWDWLLSDLYVILVKTPDIENECIVAREKTVMGPSYGERIGPSADCKLVPVARAPDASPIYMEIWKESNRERFAWLRGHKGWSYSFAGLIGPTEKASERWRLFLPSRDSQEVKLDGQRAIIRMSGIPEKWAERDGRRFKDAFRQLASLDESLENLDLETSERILYGEAKRSGDAFEAAGLKIPADVAVRCGVLLVLAVQLYMLIHLREFGTRPEREAGFDVAWIGVYTSGPARIMMLISLLILPACTVVLLSIRGLAMTEHKRVAWSALIASNAASLVLSYLILGVLPQPPTPASPTAENPHQRPRRGQTPH